MDGQLLRIPLPELNQERRKELSKLAAKYAEAARVAVRNVRRDGMDLLKKARKGRQDQPGRTAHQGRGAAEADRRAYQVTSIRRIHCQGAGNHAGLILGEV
jgi:hypothetical protein